MTADEILAEIIAARLDGKREVKIPYTMASCQVIHDLGLRWLGIKPIDDFRVRALTPEEFPEWVLL